ncbi:MAG: hypothetical protein LBP19_02760 [Treponema sp.]|jgi:hypothetical protein|nr:hypothetical protein [Treponema sp.]
MRIKTGKIFDIFSIFLPFLFNACDDTSLDTMFYLSFNPYEMSVFLDEKQQSIDTAVIINSEDTIRPYFVNSRSESDSDITGFQVFLQRADRTIREERLDYTFVRSVSPLIEADALAESAADAVPTEINEVHWTETISVSVPAWSMELPAFTLSETLAIGQYSMIFQVVGKDGVPLSSTDKPFYFLADAQFAVKDPQMYLPGGSEERMANADTLILLDVPIIWDKRLDPYIIWSEGGTEFSAGRVSEGANRILWKVPKFTGFKNISVEVFPFPPFEGTRKINGITTTISIPITEKKTKSEYSSIPDGGIHWYALQGDLSDKRSGILLQPWLITAAQWAPVSFY